jgi:hypothetical protein
MKPVILMQMTLSDGTTHTFEVSHEKFHELRHLLLVQEQYSINVSIFWLAHRAFLTVRYNVARVLKDIEEIEKHPILKI